MARFLCTREGLESEIASLIADFNGAKTDADRSEILADLARAHCHFQDNFGASANLFAGSDRSDLASITHIRRVA